VASGTDTLLVSPLNHRNYEDENPTERTMRMNHSLAPPRWSALAFTAHLLALAALAQSPLPDSFNPSANNSVYSLTDP
jgi:hypothetical protein